MTDAEKARQVRLITTVAGILSRHVGAVAALECASNAIHAAQFGVSLSVALDAAICHRVAHPRTWPDWECITNGDVTSMVRRVEEVLPC